MDMPSFDLTGKVALVTGASRGIGLAIAEAFASAGARVVLASRKQAALEQAADKIRAAGGEALPIAAHTGDPDAVRLLASEIQTRYGGLDILVNNAGTNPHFGPILSAEESHWDKTLEVNLKGYFRVIKACVDGMRQRGGGKIINVASVAGLEAQPGLGVYGVSKAGVLMLTRLLAIELAPDNIQVNALARGVIETHFSRVLWNTPGISQAIVDQIPVRRVVQPEDLTGIAL